MMKHDWAFLPILMLSALLAGCSTTATQHALKPLENAAWPTPATRVTVPVPTPFPKVSPGQVVIVNDAIPTATPVSSAQGTPDGQGSPTLAPGADATNTQTASGSVASASGRPQPSPVTCSVVSCAQARVKSPLGLRLRQGPGTSYPILSKLRDGQSVGVLGVNTGARDWALVEAEGGMQGWASLLYLDVTGSLADVPSVAADGLPPPAVANPQVGASNVKVAAPAATSSRPPLTGSLIAFQTASGGDIMIANANGSGLRRLTNGIDPVLSPDGRQVAFTRWDGDDGSLWVIGADGTNERQIAGGIKQAKHPTWSPDGKRIAVNYQHEGRLDPARSCVPAADLNDNPPNIPWNVVKDSVGVEVRGTYPNLAPYLCWTAPPDPHWSVRLIDVDTGATDDMTTDRYAYGPEWDPANPWRIVTSGFTGLDQIDVNRQVLWGLTDRREDHTPAFSPDGRFIAVAYKTGDHYDIQRLDAGGGGRVALTKAPLWLVAENKKPWNNVAPAWSPDGSQIAFLTDRNGRWEIWVMNADGSGQRPMFGDALTSQLQLTYNFVDERMLSWGD